MYFVQGELLKKSDHKISPATQWGHPGNPTGWLGKDTAKHTFLAEEEWARRGGSGKELMGKQNVYC